MSIPPNILKLVAETLFYALIILLALFSVIMIYVLLRFGKSKLLGMVVGAIYVIIMLSLYAAAVSNFNNIPFVNNLL